MIIFDLLKEEHGVALSLLGELEESAEDEIEKREELLSELSMTLLSHAQAEQVTLYARLEEDEDLASLVADAEKEHALVEKLLSELGEVGPDDEKEWKVKSSALKESVTHHLEREETELFTQAKRLLSHDEQEELGTAFREERDRLLTEMV